jgi:hypothetical protein
VFQGVIEFTGMDFSRLAKRSVKFMVDTIFVMVNRVVLRWLATVDSFETKW